MKEFSLSKIEETGPKLLKERKQRRLLVDQERQLVYKLWDADWEFAGQARLGFECGYYDEFLIPNFEGWVRDEYGRDRGYAMAYVPYGKQLKAVVHSRWSRVSLAEVRSGRVAIAEWWHKPAELKKEFLRKLLSELLVRAMKTGYVFGEMSLPNFWVSESGYHLFDLDSLRSVDWLFCDDDGDSEYERKKINAKVWHEGLDELMMAHGLQVPMAVRLANDIGRFKKELLSQFDYAI